MIISAISMGLVTSLIPHIIESYTKKDYVSSNKIFNQAISTMSVIALPLTIGIMILSDEVYRVFYGTSSYGGKILAISAVVSLAVGILSVMNTSLQGFKKFKLVIISTLIGLVTNAVLDIPMILLLNKLGITPYYGTSIATLIGASCSMIIILTYLKNNLNFKYKGLLKNLQKTIVPLLVMTIIVFLLDYLIGTPLNTLLIVLKLAILGIIGMIIYLVLMYKNKGLQDVFGEDQIISIMKKLKLK